MMDAMNTDPPTDAAPALTPHQQRVLDTIRAYWQRECRPPSIRDLCIALDIASPNGVVCHLLALAKKGAIEWEREKTARGVWPAGLRDRIREMLAA